MPKIFYFTFLALVFHCSIFAQTGFIEGIAYDSIYNNETLPFATITISPNHNGIVTQTDFDGKYKLELPVGEHFVWASFVGFDQIIKKITIKEGQTLQLNFKFTEGSNQIPKGDSIPEIFGFWQVKKITLLDDEKNKTLYKNNLLDMMGFTFFTPYQKGDGNGMLTANDGCQSIPYYYFTIEKEDSIRLYNHVLWNIVKRPCHLDLNEEKTQLIKAFNQFYTSLSHHFQFKLNKGKTRLIFKTKDGHVVLKKAEYPKTSKAYVN